MEMEPHPPVRNPGRPPPRNRDFHYFNICQHFQIFQYFQNKLSGRNNRKNRNFGVGGFDSPESIPPVGIHPPSQSRLRGDAFACTSIFNLYKFVNFHENRRGRHSIVLCCSNNNMQREINKTIVIDATRSLSKQSFMAI